MQLWRRKGTQEQAIATPKPQSRCHHERSAAQSKDPRLFFTRPECPVPASRGPKRRIPFGATSGFPTMQPELVDACLDWMACIRRLLAALVILLGGMYEF